MTDIPTFEETYNYFVDEGVWLETQTKIENEAYKRCPLCTQMAANCKALMERIAATLEVCDHEVDGSREGVEIEPIKAYWTNRLAIERQWYDATKILFLQTYQKGHSFAVVKSHPDMKRVASDPAATKARISTDDRKNKRKAQRKARQRARTRSRVS